jgi:hypothetical protein
MTTNLSGWRTVLLKSIGFGAGFALVLSMIVGAWVWRSNRPKPQKPWDAASIRATYTDLALTTLTDKMVILIGYSLENNTDTDYHQPSDTRLMMRLPGDMSYRNNPDITSEQNVFVPSRGKVNLKISVPIMYSDYGFSAAKAGDLKQLTAFADRRLAEFDGFVLFDSTNRYKVDFPNGWPEALGRSKKQEAPKSPTGDVK